MAAVQLAARHLATSETASTPSCSADYGEQYLRRWNKLQDSYCNTSSSSSAAETQTSTSSSVTCHAHPEADLATCAARNLVLQSSTAFLGSKDGIAGLPNPAAGSIRLSCKRSADPKAFLRGRLQSNEGSRMMLVQAPQFNVPAAEQARACSEGHTIQHPVLFLMRVDPENAFHNLETVVSVFAALATLQLQPQQYNGGLEVGRSTAATGNRVQCMQALRWKWCEALVQQPASNLRCTGHVVRVMLKRCSSWSQLALPCAASLWAALGQVQVTLLVLMSVACHTGLYLS